MKINKIVITPETALKLLENNVMNRPLSEKHVNNIAAALLRGEWILNGDAIRLSKCGKLLDGQHRLNAVVRSGVSIDTIIIDGLDVSSFHTIDVGRKNRGAADVLAISGESNYCALSNALLVIWMLENNEKSPYGGQKITVAQVEETLERNPLIRNYLTTSKEIKTLMSVGVFSAIHYLYSIEHKEKADDFYEKFSTGYGLEYGSPIALLRDRLMKNRASKAKLGRKNVLALLIKAFNAHILNKKVFVLKYSEEESFPVILRNKKS